MNKQKIIILEGCEKVGKTSIGKRLSEVLDVPYFKNSNEHTHFFDEDIARYRFLDQLYIYDFLKQTGYSVILDRAFPSDIVYTQVFRNHDQKLIDTLYDIDRKFSSLDTFVIYFRKHGNLVKDEIINKENFVHIRNEYNIFLQNTKCNTMEINTSDEDVNNQITRIFDKLIRKI